MVGSDTEATVMLNVVPGLNTGITAFNAGLSSINAQFQNVTDAIGRTFGVVDSMIVSSGLMVAQFGMGAANAFGEFEQGMQIVKAVSQQSGQSMAYLKQEAQDFAVQYRTGIDSITEGLQTLGRAGLNSAQEQTEVLEQGLQTAKLEGRELNGVLEEIIQNTTLLGADTKSDQFGEQAEYLNNLLVGTSLSSPIDTHDISETLKYSGGMVAAAGGTIATDEGYANEQGREIVEDYMGAIAAFGQKGVKGSIAGTALRAFFNKPATQDKSVVEALEAIGLAPEDLWNDEETMKPVSEQIELIQTQMNAKNVSKMDQMQLWSKIVGGKMGQQMMKLDAQDIREMTTDIESAGSARELSEQTFNTYNQQVNKFTEEGQKAFREFGQHIVTAIRPALDILTKFMDLLSNPAISFAGFVAFTAIISHALQAILRIAGRFKSELGWLLQGNTGGFNPQAMLDAAHKGDISQPYLNILKPSDINDYDLSKSPIHNVKEAQNKKNRQSDAKKRAEDYFNTKQQGYEKINKQYSSMNNSIKSSMSQIASDSKQLISQISGDIDALIDRIYNKIQLIDIDFDTKKLELKVDNLVDSILKKFDALDLNIDLDINDLGQNIQQVGATADEVIKKETEKASEAIELINKQIEALKVNMTMGPTSGQVIPDGMSKSDLKSSYTVTGLKSLLMQRGNYTKQDLKGLRKDDLVDMAHPLVNPDISQIFDGNMANLDSDVMKIFHSDPYLKQFLIAAGMTPEDIYGNISSALPTKFLPATFTDEEDLIETANLPSNLTREQRNANAARFLGMFPPHISQLPEDAQLFADTMNMHNPVKLGIMDENMKLMHENPEEVKILDGIFKAVEAIHNNMVIEDHDVNEEYYGDRYRKSLEDKELEYDENHKQFVKDRVKQGSQPVNEYDAGLDSLFGDHPEREKYYDAHTSMRDAIEEENRILDENTKSFRESYFWNKTGNNNYHDEGLASLFDESNSKNYRDNFWGGMTEEEFNRQYYRHNSPAWYTDINDINFADDVSEETKRQVQEFINKNNEAYGYSADKGEIEPIGKGEIEPVREGEIEPVLNVIPDGAIEPVNDELKTAKKQLGELFEDSSSGKLKKAWGSVTDTFNGFAKTLGSKSTNVIGKTIDILGGPFSAALMGATAAMEIYNYAFGQWQKQTQEHQTKLSEAQDKMSEAEGNIREEYLKNNPNATQADADKAVDDAYLAIEDNDYNLSALDENTQALYVATYQVQQASALLEGDAMHGAFGVRGAGTLTNYSDNLITGLTNQIFGSWGTQIIQDSGEMGYAWGKLGFGYNTQAGSILDNSNQAVLTGSQSSDDYVYSKENAAIFAADVWAASKEKGKEAIDGLWDFFGTDVKHFQEVNRSIFGGTTDFGNSYYTHATNMLNENFSSSSNQHQLQMFLKNNKRDAQKLGKEIRKFEKKHGSSPISYFTDKKGGKVPNQKALKNLEVKDKDLVKYLRSLSIKTGMSAQQLLMASQLQQMQDLNQIMSEQVQPQVLGLAQNAYQQLAAQNNIGGNTGNTSSGAWSTYSAAAAIASKLNVLVEQALDTEMQQDYINSGGQNQEYIDNPQKMKADMIKAYNTPEAQRTAEQKELVNTYGRNWLDAYYLSGWDSAHPGASEADRQKALENYRKNVSQYKDFAGAVGATRKGANAYYTQSLMAAYDASKLGEDGESPSGGSGGGGGDGGSDKGSDKDTGTKKERVDLVLCNKKEIPKLNVNLFKKAPQFTVLNKNFKLRDIKINTQDKPKAVLDSLKNAIIDTQKRMDPKIIQDEEAEYDPVAATDGNKTPSGSTSTTTDD